MTKLARLALLCCCVSVAGCNSPAPRPWLRFVPSAATTWNKEGDGVFTGSLHGAAVKIDLSRRQTRIEVTVQNPTAAAVEVRMGPEAAAPKAAIGEVLLRPLGGPPGVRGPDMLPYNGMQAIVVDAGWRGTFYLDAPLGREPTVGQSFVFTVEARDGKGVCERRTMPLVATNAGTRAADGT